MRMREKNFLTQSTQSLKTLRSLFNIFVLFPTPCPTGGVGGGVAGLFVIDKLAISKKDVACYVSTKSEINLLIHKSCETRHCLVFTNFNDKNYPSKLFIASITSPISASVIYGCIGKLNTLSAIDSVTGKSPLFPPKYA